MNEWGWRKRKETDEDRNDYQGTKEEDGRVGREGNFHAWTDHMQIRIEMKRIISFLIRTRIIRWNHFPN